MGSFFVAVGPKAKILSRKLCITCNGLLHVSMSWTRPYLDGFCRLIFTDPPLVNSRWTSGWDGYWVIRPTPALARTSHITVISGQYYITRFCFSAWFWRDNFLLFFPVSKIPYSEVWSGCVKWKDMYRCFKLLCVEYILCMFEWYEDEFCQLKICFKQPSIHIMLLLLY